MQGSNHTAHTQAGFTCLVPSRYSRCERCAPEMVDSSSGPSSVTLSSIGAGLIWCRRREDPISNFAGSKEG